MGVQFLSLLLFLLFEEQVFPLFVKDSNPFEELDTGYSDAMKEATEENLIIENSEMGKVCERVLHRLLVAANEPKLYKIEKWEIVVMKYGSPALHITPEGKFYVCEGLFSILENEDELAALIAHQLSIVLHRDKLPLVAHKYLHNGTHPFRSCSEAVDPQFILTTMALAQYDPAKSTVIWRRIGGLDISWNHSLQIDYPLMHSAKGLKLQDDALHEAYSLYGVICLNEGTIRPYENPNFWNTKSN